MNQESICKEIKKNKSLNGYYDMCDGDVMAMEVDKEHLDCLTEVRNLKSLFNSLYNGVSGNWRYKNIVFANHYNSNYHSIV